MREAVPASVWPGSALVMAQLVPGDPGRERAGMTEYPHAAAFDSSAAS